MNALAHVREAGFLDDGPSWAFRAALALAVAQRAREMISDVAKGRTDIER
jgi:hypothetical protein